MPAGHIEDVAGNDKSNEKKQSLVALSARAGFEKYAVNL